MARPGLTAQRRWRGLLLAAALASGAAACAEEATTLDSGAAEANVRDALARRLDREVDQVRCPDAIPLGRGRTFACTAVLGDGLGDLRVEVRQVDDAGDLDVVPLAAVVDRAAVVAQLQSELRAEFGRSFQADCGEEAVEVIRPGERFTCTARDANSRRSVDVTVVDAAGSLRFDVLPPP